MMNWRIQIQHYRLQEVRSKQHSNGRQKFSFLSFINKCNLKSHYITYKEIVFAHSSCRPTICHSPYKIWNRNVERQKPYDRLDIGITGITVFKISPHQSPYIVLSVLKGPFLRLGLSYKLF